MSAQTSIGLGEAKKNYCKVCFLPTGKAKQPPVFPDCVIFQLVFSADKDVFLYTKM